MLKEQSKTTEENVYWKSENVKITREDNEYIIQFDMNDPYLEDDYKDIPSWRIPVKFLDYRVSTDYDYPLYHLLTSFSRMNDKVWNDWENEVENIDTYNEDLGVDN